ncbi:MAG: hypothetical protein RL685_2485 [Pseudomonadota bacterium]|jgi:hypothetical protein
MASQTKVDSAGRRAAERRAEGSTPSNASNTSASGTYATRGEAGEVSSELAGPADDNAESSSDDLASYSERLATGADLDADAAGGADSDSAAARVSSIEELGTRASSAEDDEDVSIDELLISDSSDGEEEEEATDIHPGLSESLLAESLRPETVPSLPRRSVAAEATREDASEPEEAEPVSELTAASPSDELLEAVASRTEDSTPADAAFADGDPEEVVVGAAVDELATVDELAAESERHVQEASGSLDGDDMEAAPESEAAMEVEELAPESEVTPESVRLDAEDGLETDVASEGEPMVVADLDVEETTAEPPRVAPVAQQSERQTLPEPIAAKRGDAPLPSFDIPEPEATSARQARTPAEHHARPSTGSVALPEHELSEVGEEDDDDAVTHMGLPVVPEVANDYPTTAPGRFAVADPAVAALQSLDADLARGDSRRATTRVIPRIDPKTLPRPRGDAPAGPPLGERLSGLARGAWERVSTLIPTTPAEPPWGGGEVSPGRRRLAWLVENVLPPLSLVLFGSGLGAGVIMLVDNDAPSQTQTVQALQESSSAARGPLTLADRARLGDGEALYKITNMPHGERTSALTLALEAGYQAQKQKEFREFAKVTTSSAAPPSAGAVGRVVEYATSPETMLPAFQELTQWPGSVGPDLLYSVWEKAAGGSRAASLAQQLLYSADQRSKATPALLVALDLRSAATCDDYLRVLPAAVRDGDQRSSATLRALRHGDGCGADGRQDCYACLRDSPLLENALKAIDRR